MVLAGFSLGSVLPELILAMGALSILLLGAIGGERWTKPLYEASIVVLGIVLLTVVFNHRPPSASFDAPSWMKPSRTS